MKSDRSIHRYQLSKMNSISIEMLYLIRQYEITQQIYFDNHCRSRENALYAQGKLIAANGPKGSVIYRADKMSFFN